MKRSHDCLSDDKSFPQKKPRTYDQSIRCTTREFICTICQQVFKSQNNLTNHLQTHEEKRKYACTTCDKKFLSRRNLLNHATIHTETYEHECTICHSFYKRSDTLRTHIRTVHNDERKFQCDDCGMTFKLKHVLISHQITHRNERKYACDECGAAFNLPGGLKQHLLIHQNILKHECERCKAKFRYKPLLNQHMKSHHAAPVPL
jgi:uncharacterized Zn-finger protein